MTSTTCWWISSLVSLSLISLLALQWHRIDTSYKPNHLQLDTDQKVFEHLADFRTASDERGESPILIKTGVFVQSLRFLNSTDIHMTGYVWQHYPTGLPDDLAQGFVLPEAIDSGGLAAREAYRREDPDGSVIGWYIETTLRQKFNYSRFPLDHKTVWMRLWHADFDRSVILVPDLASYDSTSLEAAFGIDPKIVLADWHIAETFFDYEPASYDTNFGISDYSGQKKFPELYFNVVIHRNFGDAFVTHLVPLTVTALLLFAMLLTVTNDPELQERFAFSTSGAVSAASALFFVVMLSHVQLRRELSGAGVVYLGLFYFMMYAVMIGVVANTYLFSLKNAPKIIRLKDNLIAKIAFWPVILATINLITLIVFWEPHELRNAPPAEKEIVRIDRRGASVVAWHQGPSAQPGPAGGLHVTKPARPPEGP